MSSTASTTYVKSPTDASYVLYLRGPPSSQQTQTYQHPTSGTLSPLPSPNIVGFQNPPAHMALPADYFDRRDMVPPPLDWARSPYATIPLPRLYNYQVTISPLLEHTPIPMIEYHLASLASSAALSVRRRSAAGRSLDEPATNPPTPSLTIRTGLSPRPISVHRFGATVTVRDVLVTVHQALCEAALEHGYPRHDFGLLSPDHPDRPSEENMQRLLVYLLGNRPYWAGLSASTEPDVWILHVR